MERHSLKRKPESEISLMEGASSDSNNKRHQFENGIHTAIIELIPNGSDISVIHKPTEIVSSNGGIYSDHTQQFIELANVTFDQHNFINVENIYHTTSHQPIHVHSQHNHGEYAGQIWNGTDLIVLENCPVPSSAPTPPLQPPPPPHILPTERQEVKFSYTQSHSQGSMQPPKGYPSNKDTEDVEDKNLSWLLNFKLDELPHLSPETKRKSVNTNQSSTDPSVIEKAFEDDTNVAENIVIENTVKTPKKPPFTYTELIEYALEDQGELTVSGIYQWISDRFKYYKSNDDRWKNSVRHNLSINPHFRKGSKATQGAGHLWTISSRDSEVNLLAWEHKKQRLELFFKMEESAARREAESFSQEETMLATASIMQQRDNSITQGPTVTTYNDQTYPGSNQTQMEFENGQNDLRRSAGEILNGVKRNVEVQVMHPVDNTNYHSYTILDSDYLNPISKEEIVQECGLRTSRRSDNIGNEFYVTTIDPIELGINMSATSGSEEIFFEDDFNFSYFGNNIMA